jgi:hypothetical protein
MILPRLKLYRFPRQNSKSRFAERIDKTAQGILLDLSS